MNKRGQDLSIGTLILIVLGIIVLVLLILGFSMGWGNLWEKINIFGGGGSSIESVISACNIAVASGSEYSYCQDFKKIKINQKTEYVNCQDNRVQPNLNSQLECNGKTATQSAQEYCKNTLSKQIKKATEVNKVTCQPVEEIICKDYIELIEREGASIEVTGNEKNKPESCGEDEKDVSANVKLSSEDKICCIPTK